MPEATAVPASRASRNHASAGPAVAAGHGRGSSASSYSTYLPEQQSVGGTETESCPNRLINSLPSCNASTTRLTDATGGHPSATPHDAWHFDASPASSQPCAAPTTQWDVAGGLQYPDGPPNAPLTAPLGAVPDDGTHGTVIPFDEDTVIEAEGTSIEELESWAVETCEQSDNNTQSAPRTEERVPASESLRAQILRALYDRVPDLAEFLDDNRAPNHESGPGIFEKYEQFVEDEASASGWEPAHLVRPSGAQHAALHLKLHYPSFTTVKPDWGETCDSSNGCIRLLTSKGLSAENAF